MKTDELVALLASEAQPVRRRASQALGLAVAAALPVSIAIMAIVYGVRPGLVASLADQPMAWIKILLPAALGAAAFVALQRLARPGVRVRGAWAGLLAPVLLLWVLGALAWTAAPAEARPELLWGRTWRTCVFNIALIATPLFLAAFMALRGLAPTRPALAGAAAGALASGIGAAVYALHCPELAAPFLGVWYVLGMALPAATGAMLGRALLRW